jgi:WD40 repeat protein
VEVWDIKSGNIILNIEVFSAPATSAAVSPDGRFVAVTRNPQTEIWDVSSGEVVYKFQPNRSVFAFSADGRRLVASDLNGSVELWDISQLK